LNEDAIIGFLDESSPQTTANTQRLWSFTKPTICKNTTKLRANSFGFYALNGNSVINFKEHSRKEDVCEFLAEIRSKNPTKNIILILDNFRSHRANFTMDFAEDWHQIDISASIFSRFESDRIYLEKHKETHFKKFHRRCKSHERYHLSKFSEIFIKNELCQEMD